MDARHLQAAASRIPRYRMRDPAVRHKTHPDKNRRGRAPRFIDHLILRPHMAKQKREHKAGKSQGPKNAGKGRGSPGPRDDLFRAMGVPENPDLKDLLQVPAGASPGDNNDAIFRRLDDAISDSITLDRLIGFPTDGFQHILAGFTKEIMGDESRPLFRDDTHGRSGPKISHLLLMVLMDVRGGPVQSGMEAIFNVDHDTAREYLKYGKSMCTKVLETPDKIVARIMDGLEREEYDEVERLAPEFTLLVGFKEMEFTLEDGTPKTVNVLFIITMRDLILEGWQIPQDCTDNMDAFGRYVSGEGRYLEKMTRQMPDGRRWTISHDIDDCGILKLLPEVAVTSLDGPDHAGAPRPRGVARKSKARRGDQKPRTGGRARRAS
ncbi:hypothetical protein CENSYa_2054 [Cenarchaeum symbiosum A]|uniref:Uncharacterized protein n=1 Tax=Cenarchaeum symbiosum (strain A) TaxID=414004 RepID=A0RZ90_CENSY|nr:hypothetical protein CENSYa_2054 [Cenarchaeum symbiosum A]